MAKRLQVILKDPEYREIKRAARSRQMSIAEWVRQALDLSHRRDPVGEVSKKLEVIRGAARCNYPTGDIDRMLAEIEMGYGLGAQMTPLPGGGKVKKVSTHPRRYGP